MPAACSKGGISMSSVFNFLCKILWPPDKDQDEEAYYADRKEIITSATSYIISAGMLVLFVSLSIAVSNFCVTATMDNFTKTFELNEKVLWWIRSFFTAFFGLIVFFVAVIGLELANPNKKWVLRQAKRLQEIIDILAGKTNATVDSPGLVPRIEQATKNLEEEIIPAFSNTTSGGGIVEALKGVIEKLELLHEQVIFYEGDPGKTLHDFICHPNLVGNDLKTIRFFGTMMGSSGEGSYSLTNHIIDLWKLNLERKRLAPAFEECRVVLPGPRNLIDRDSKKSEIYPVCGRYFALDTLKKIRGLHDSERTPTLSINLRFKECTDCFPAWHLWGEKAFVILCSIGACDRRSSEKRTDGLLDPCAIADALPIAIGAHNFFSRKSKGTESEFDLSYTIKRLSKHFDADLYQEHAEGIEKWILCAQGIYIENLQEEVWGKEMEEKIKQDLPFWEEVYEKSKQQYGYKIPEEKIDATILIFQQKIYPETEPNVFQLGSFSTKEKSG
jgi:hypothetical protein